MSLFLKSTGIGLAVAAPIGPMALLCMRSTLTRGVGRGLAIGGGIASADAIYATVAACGLAGVSEFALAYETPMHLAAGLFLVYLGLKSLRAEAGAAERTIAPGQGLAKDYSTALLLTLANPPTIVMFAAVFAALAPSAGFRPLDALATVAGVFAGSLLWWCLLIGAVGALRRSLGGAAREWIDRLSGVVLAGLGVVELRRGLG
ncbi:LysE family translocator [Methylosinus sp. Ce-a6]|uniref:LysE family translocator n=1 Tax=Methylosinus sp. Ce-a6 TaxID=2172005 RepID=UPI001357480E|nr:LysE family translocator [Methylosinus sp. Ce-a6]